MQFCSNPIYQLWINAIFVTKSFWCDNFYSISQIIQNWYNIFFTLFFSCSVRRSPWSSRGAGPPWWSSGWSSTCCRCRRHRARHSEFSLGCDAIAVIVYILFTASAAHAQSQILTAHDRMPGTVGGRPPYWKLSDSWPARTWGSSCWSQGLREASGRPYGGCRGSWGTIKRE